MDNATCDVFLLVQLSFLWVGVMTAGTRLGVVFEMSDQEDSDVYNFYMELVWDRTKSTENAW